MLSELEYGSLRDLLDFAEKKRELPFSLIWKILIDMAKGLEYIHDKGFAHRDLHPGNLLFSVYPDFVVKVLARFFFPRVLFRAFVFSTFVFFLALNCRRFVVFGVSREGSYR
jgi:serine/threonine protein kinase